MKMMLVTEEQNSENMGKLSFFFFDLKWYALSNATCVHFKTFSQV